MLIACTLQCGLVLHKSKVFRNMYKGHYPILRDSQVVIYSNIMYKQNYQLAYLIVWPILQAKLSQLARLQLKV